MIEMINILIIDKEGYSYIVDGLINTETDEITRDAVDPEDDLSEAEWTDNYWINNDGIYGMEE